MKRLRCWGVSCVVAAFALAGSTAWAQNHYGEILQDGKIFDRPDLLNFNPMVPTETWEGSTTTWTFSSMGVEYETSTAQYLNYGRDCFDDPDADAMLDVNRLCVRAGHSKPNTWRDPRLYISSYYPFSYGPDYPLIHGLFGSDVYVSGSFNVETGGGGRMFAYYKAEIPDRLSRSDNRIKFEQSAFVDFQASIFDDTPSFLGSFRSWFEGCEVKAKVKGVAASSVGPMAPPVKQGNLEKGKGKLKCDKDAIEAMVTKLTANAGEDSAAAVSIFQAALEKLGSSKHLKLKTKDRDGTEIVSDDDDVVGPI